MLMMLAGMLPCMVLRPPFRDAAKCSGRSDVLGELNTINTAFPVLHWCTKHLCSTPLSGGSGGRVDMFVWGV